jgi:hypothetical protein
VYAGWAAQSRSPHGYRGSWAGTTGGGRRRRHQPDRPLQRGPQPCGRPSNNPISRHLRALPSIKALVRNITPVCAIGSNPASDTNTGAISPKHVLLEHARQAAGPHRGLGLRPAQPPPVREAAMTARPVPPVVPAASPGCRPGKPGTGRPMPLASPPGRPDVVYGFGRIDASGRVADRVTSPRPAHPAVPGRRDFVEAAPALTGDPRLRLPPAPSHCCDSRPMDGLSPPLGQTAPRGALPQVPAVADLHR